MCISWARRVFDFSIIGFILMKIDDFMVEVLKTVDIIKVRLDHTVTWKELSSTALGLFCAICAGVWFLVGQTVETKLAGAEERLSLASSEAVDIAKKELAIEMRAALDEISDSLDKNSNNLVEISTLIEKQNRTIVVSADFKSRFDGISKEVKTISDILANRKNTNPAYVTFNSTSPIGATVLSSPELEKFAKTWGLDLDAVVNTGQIIVPFGDIKLSPGQ